MSSTRHKWTLVNRLEHVTIRQCSRCGMFKNTRHEGGQHWTEFVLECEPVDSHAGTPPCDARFELEAAAVLAGDPPPIATHITDQVVEGEGVSA